MPMKKIEITDLTDFIRYRCRYNLPLTRFDEEMINIYGEMKLVFFWRKGKGGLFNHAGTKKR